MSPWSADGYKWGRSGRCVSHCLLPVSVFVLFVVVVSLPCLSGCRKTGFVLLRKRGLDGGVSGAVGAYLGCEV